MAINITRDYFTIKEVANVGAVYSEDENKISVVIHFGMGGNDFKIDLTDYLEEENLDVSIKYLMAELKTV